MGLFKRKHNDIIPKQNKLKTLVTNYSGRNGTLIMNSKLVVPENYTFVIGKKGKATDRFDAGEYFLNYTNLPYSCRKFGIDKYEGDKKGKFICEHYFLEKGVFSGKFKTYRKVQMGTKAYGLFKAGVCGVYTYKIANEIEFMQSLLNGFDYIKTGEAEKLIEAWVSEVVVDALEKNNFIIDDCIKNSPIIADTLKRAVAKLFKVAGLELLDLYINKYKLPKQYQEESDKIVKMQEDQRNGVINDIAAEDKEETNAHAEQEDNQMTAKQDDNSLNQQSNEPFEYVPFGNIVIEEHKNATINQTANINNEKSFVDLNLNRLYDSSSKNTKRCLRCGGENQPNASRCTLCGEIFESEEY